MTLARVLAVTLLLCSLSAFAQDQQTQSSWPSTGVITVHFKKGPSLNREFFFSNLNLLTAATATEPWRIFPDTTAAVVSGQTRPDQTPADQAKLEFRVRQLLESQIDRLSEEGPTCYAIRSYVVARDSKDSDSTHPAGYSTCQPVGRYGVKTITSGPEPADR